MPPKDYPDYAAYQKWFDREYAAFEIPNDCSECGPFRGPTLVGPARPPWKLRWWLVFLDGYFINCTEYYESRRGFSPQVGHLSQFSYHYGLHPGVVDKNGCPKHSTSEGTIFRIDLAPDYADHIHFAGHDHIRQDQLKGGFVIMNQTMFDFVARILVHRRTGKPITECFDFEVR